MVRNWFKNGDQGHDGVLDVSQDELALEIDTFSSSGTR